MSNAGELPDSAYVVLAVLAEGENHGYGIEKLVHTRGFRFWTSIKRSSVYKALPLLESRGLITAHDEAGDGPARKVYRITEPGRDQLSSQGLAKLAEPAHPRSEIDLALYVLPFLPRDEAGAALEKCRETLRQREAFLAERLAWCRARELTMPALSFERPLLALRAELGWLDRIIAEYAAGAELRAEDWNAYAYKEP